MAIRIECPSCKTSFNVIDGVAGKNVRCAKCASTFKAEGRSAASPAPVQPRPSPASAAATPAAGRGSSTPPRDRDKGSWLMPVMIFGGLGLGSCLVVGVGAACVWLLRPASPTPNPDPYGTQSVAVGNPDVSLPIVVPQPQRDRRPKPILQPGDVQPPAEQPRPDEPVALPKPEKPVDPPKPEVPVPVAKPPENALPEARPGKDNSFVDLPERGEGMPQIAGLTPPPPDKPAPPPEKPAGKTAATLTKGAATRIVGKAGMVFAVDYRFEGERVPGTRYSWVIITARGRAFKQTLIGAQIRDQGTLSGRALGAAFMDGPYTTYLAIEKPGLQEERISPVLSFR